MSVEQLLLFVHNLNVAWMIGRFQRDIGRTPHTDGESDGAVLLHSILIGLAAGVFSTWLFLQLPRTVLVVLSVVQAFCCFCGGLNMACEPLARDTRR